MKTVAIVDYGMGNIDSIARVIEECGGSALISHNPVDFETATHIILPGVGSFSTAMESLSKLNLVHVLKTQVMKYKIPFLGICLGMQLLATKGHEGGDHDGLNLIEGEIVLLKTQNIQERIPHVGWNEVFFEKQSPLFNNIETGKDFYFVHSYHYICKDKQDILAYTPYCGKFVSIIGRENIFGTQFHPEKSQRLGFQLIKNFLDI
jgi:imidazole glycerol-phosphate synthase subunit HisH